MKKYLHVVGAIIENETGEVLCALRGPKMSLPDYWEFPGGKVEKGETPVNALKREIKEELGCVIEVFDRVEDTTYEYEAIIVRLVTYMAQIVMGTPTASEHSAIEWVKSKNLNSLNWAPADLPAVERMLAQCKKESMNN